MKKKPFPPHRKIAAVLWNDACSYAQRGFTQDEVDDPQTRSVMVLSAGIVLADDEEGMELVLNKNIVPVVGNPGETETNYDFAICIPRAYIRKVKYLK